jgi:two-component system, chemotaxis family, protein-glutamate methylesterase/glutaminase
MSQRIFVVGASLGGVHALQRLVADLPTDFPAPVLIVLHIGHHRSQLPELLKPKSGRAMHAEDATPLKAGEILVAPPDQHMLVEGDRVRLSRGPKEHFSRPAIDPLFRSAAIAHGPAVTGVVLTGLLDDGTAGLQAIKSCGGTTVVQDPADAQEPSMPSSALRHVDIDHCVPLAGMAEVLGRIVSQAPQAMPAVPARLIHEHELTLKRGHPLMHLNEIGTPSAFVCPDCSGGLWELKDVDPPRYRCHTGHAYTLRTLQHAHSIGTDEALWNALRALQEQRFLLEKGLTSGLLPSEHEAWEAAARRLEHEAMALRQLLESHQSPVEP